MLIKVAQPHTKTSTCGIVNLRNDFLFLIGGVLEPNKYTHNLVQRYDIKEDTFTNPPNMNQKRSYPGACIVDNKFMYAIGGF